MGRVMGRGIGTRNEAEEWATRGRERRVIAMAEKNKQEGIWWKRETKETMGEK